VRRLEEKKAKLEAKRRTKLAESKRKHKELWSLKNVIALGEKLHATIWVNAPVTRYKPPYCGVIPPMCKENQRLAIE